jgi:hypothetical protein
MTVRFDSEAESAISSSAARPRSGEAVPRLAFCANCESERLDLIAARQTGLQVHCYVCTKTSDVAGVILGEVDFLAGAQAKVEQMIARAREHAAAKAKRGFAKAR